MQDQKATLKILLFILLICTVIIVPFYVMQELNFDDNDFPDYQNIIISENRLEDEIEYNKIKQQLQNDFYFNKIAIMMEYDSDYYTSSKLEEMVWHFIFNYELENTDYFTKIDKEKEIYCMKKSKFIDAFEELYNVDITNDEKLLKGYYKYIYNKPGAYCFDAGNVAKEYDNDIKIGIERLAMIGTSITADVNVYEYYTSSSNNQYITELENAINNQNFASAKSIIDDKLKGTTQKKQIKFKMNKHGDYFKYTILSVKNIEY